MIKVINERTDLCVGCNRCVRECPMEMANITYQDESGNIKSIIDYEKCIHCGRCVSACKHNARYFTDDTGRFFGDLSKGTPVSLIAAPSIRTNIPEYKKLFTYLKKIGVNKIYDVSLGADICIWAHIKHLESNPDTHIITQSCPAIVSYCEAYRHDLLDNLSPVHSPMACTSVYIKEHEGINDRIAALSPCMAKTIEFEKTKLADYNVTFSKLLEYLRDNSITLPDEETDFDHAETGLGSLFPMPGGFRENIEYFMGKRLHITGAEGEGVYAKLDRYAQTPEDFLPDIYDVLGCTEGCNIGTASSSGRCVFEIGKTMNDSRMNADSEAKRKHYEAVFRTYDDTLEFSRYLRTYKALPINLPAITDWDIENAFKQMGKDDEAKQHIDCFACGSETCYDMARKIALDVNIPGNCIFKIVEDSKEEHEQNLRAHAQIVAMEKAHEADERIRIMFDTMPFAAHFWDENLNMTDCNEAAAKMFNLPKDEYLKRYYESMPEEQPDGIRSDIKMRDIIQKTFETGYQRVEIMNLSPDGEEIPTEDTYVRVNYKGTDIVAGYSRDLREHKRMLREREELNEGIQFQLAKLNMIIKTARIGLWEMDIVRNDMLNPDNKIIWSDEFRHIMGFEGEHDFPNVLRMWSEHLHPDDAEKTANAIVSHWVDKTGMTPYDAEFRIKKKNGEYAYISASSTTVRDEEGNAVRSAGTLIDITPMKNLVDEAELQMTKLNMAMKAGKVMMWEMEVVKDDPANPQNKVSWPDEFRYLLGFRNEEEFPNTVGSLFSRIHPDDLERVSKAAVSHTMDKTGQIPYNVEYRLTKKDGGMVHIHATGETVRDEDGNPLRTAGTIIDITQTKNLVHTLENVLNNIDEFIYVTDRHTDEILFVNDAMRRHYGIEGDGIGQVCYKVFQEGYDKRCDFCPCYKLDKDPDSTVVWQEHSTVTNRTYRNTDRYIKWINGEIVHIQHSVDVTELFEAKVQAEKQRTEAETASKAKSEFLSHISHEIRTPMNAVLGAAEIQLQKENNTPEAEEAFSTIYNSGNLLLNIINDILDLSKIEAGKLEIIPAPYDIPSIVYDTVQLNLLRYESKPIEFGLKIDENTPLDLHGDELRIKQVLNNIMSNAFKYTDKGGVELDVSAEYLTGDDVILVLRVSDTGQGMTEEELEKLFEEYARFNLDINRTIVGTGLGMHITKRLIDTMNGEITVESELGKGSVFTVRLPQKRLSDVVCGTELAEKLQNSRFKSTLKLNRAQIVHEYMPYGRILIADDVESNLYVAKGMMLPYGLQIETVTSGFAVLDKIKSGNEYDIIFMDHMMPRMNGVETTKHLRDMGYGKPVVALTANAIAGSAEMFMSNGFDGYISKPIDMRELNTALNRFIRDKQSPEVIEAARREIGRPHEVDGELAAAVIADINNALHVLEEAMNSGDIDIELFTTTTHGMKSALLNIDETELSGIAFKLEKAGGNNDIDLIKSETPVFISALKVLTGKYKQVKINGFVTSSEASDDAELLREKLNVIITSCNTFNKKAAKTALDELKKKKWSRGITDALNEIMVCLLRGEFGKAADVAARIMPSQ